jgi:predicted  nucleic acid-binding Zn-ribbon protein
MPADHTHHLAEHARQHHDQTLQRAQQTLTELTDAGEQVTVALLAARARVSRSWIYTQPELRNRLRQLQQRHASAGFVRDAVTRATDDSLRQRLALAHERINQLRTENQQLRDALARAHGELRATRLNVERTCD